ncbi:hypothetical protein [Helicobacter suis]|uniref:hypothetical protein n=1 Tax=Helicobacter suis TaxID=104628 RepID=UPI0013D1ECCC|nr:hypothetical protein [Helicobacter suis]
MLAVIEIIEAIRARLKDDNYTNLRFSDMELLDTLNSALAALILEFKLNKHQISQQIKDNQPIYLDNLLGIECAYFNNNLIECTSVPTDQLSLVVDQNSLSIAPFTQGHLRLTYYAHEPINSLEDHLRVPALAKNALIYDCLGKLLEIPTNENNPNTIALYKQLLKEAKNTLTLHLNNLYGRNYYFSKVVRV